MSAPSDTKRAGVALASALLGWLAIIAALVFSGLLAHLALRLLLFGWGLA
jgi:hypothetical protein